MGMPFTSCCHPRNAPLLGTGCEARWAVWCYTCTRDSQKFAAHSNTEYPALEGSHKDHWVQLLAPGVPKNQNSACSWNPIGACKRHHYFWCNPVKQCFNLWVDTLLCPVVPTAKGFSSNCSDKVKVLPKNITYSRIDGPAGQSLCKTYSLLKSWS